MLPAQLKGQASYGAPTPSSVNVCLSRGGEAKDPAGDRCHLWGCFTKLRLSVPMEKRKETLFVEEAPGTANGTERFLRPQTPFRPGQTEGSL